MLRINSSQLCPQVLKGLCHLAEGEAGLSMLIQLLCGLQWYSDTGTAFVCMIVNRYGRVHNLVQV